MGRRSDHSREELHELVMNAAMGITETEGLHGLSARKIMREVGYTIGTFYQLYGRVDDLILEVNGRTLDELYEECAAVPQKGRPETKVIKLAERYISFTRAHAKRWSMLFEHRLPDGEELPEWHHGKVRRLLELVDNALAPVFPANKERERQHAARVLWSSLHGICSLEASNKLARTEDVEAMNRTLITNFISGLRAKSKI